MCPWLILTHNITAQLPGFFQYISPCYQHVSVSSYRHGWTQMNSNRRSGSCPWEMVIPSCLNLCPAIHLSAMTSNLCAEHPAADNCTVSVFAQCKGHDLPEGQAGGSDSQEHNAKVTAGHGGSGTSCVAPGQGTSGFLQQEAVSAGQQFHAGVGCSGDSLQPREAEHGAAISHSF